MQLNMPLNIDWQQILLHLFNFVILFGVLYVLLYSPVKSFMDKRGQHYRDMNDEAEQKLALAEQARQEYLHHLEHAEEEADGIKEKARKDIEELNAIKIKDTEEQAKKIIAEAHEDAERERNKILKEAQNQISDMVTDAAKKIISHSTSEAYDSFLNAAKRSGEDE